VSGWADCYGTTTARLEHGRSFRTLRACEEIAAASGGILRLGLRTSAEERAVIERVATKIQKTHEAAARRVAGSL
jgi:hypothetical protein